MTRLIETEMVFSILLLTTSDRSRFAIVLLLRQFPYSFLQLMIRSPAFSRITVLTRAISLRTRQY